jgi:hypothetical protein
MSLVMPALGKNKSGAYTARYANLADVRDDYERLYGKRREERFRVPAGTTPAQAKRQYADWHSEISGRIATLRAVRRGEGIELSHKDAVALSGRWYSWFVARYHDEPGDPKRWDMAFRELIDEAERYAPKEVRERPWIGMDWTRDPEVLSHIRPYLADVGLTA